ncbi:hypothetical protein [Streptomyces sp. NPDC056821]|uniref:hypothetical protein n=1 Tax=unclassified Streptomyces TaxID=2593676 RepID=UPI0036AFF8D1
MVDLRSPDLDGQALINLLGVFLSNTKTRRAKLTADRLQTLADLGLDWAVQEGAGR